MECRPLVWAHRGASKICPENTLSAFRAALEAGADGVELDVHLSAGDHVVRLRSQLRQVAEQEAAGNPISDATAQMSHMSLRW